MARVRRQLSLGEALERSKPDTPRLVCLPSCAQNVQAGGGVGRRHWRPCLSEPAGDLAWQIPMSGLGIGPEGLRHQQCLCLCIKDLLPAPAQSVAPCWGPACVWEQVICRPRAPCRACTVLPPRGLGGSWPRRMVVGLALHGVGAALSTGPWVPGWAGCSTCG